MDNLTAYIAKKGITDKRLASLVGVTPYTVWRWKTGRREPSVKNLIQLGNVLDCTPNDLLGVENVGKEKLI